MLLMLCQPHNWHGTISIFCMLHGCNRNYHCQAFWHQWSHWWPNYHSRNSTLSIEHWTELNIAHTVNENNSVRWVEYCTPIDRIGQLSSWMNWTFGPRWLNWTMPIQWMRMVQFNELGACLSHLVAIQQILIIHLCCRLVRCSHAKHHI